MAVTTRSRKLWLNEAWMHYWSVLFPASSDWRTDLENEIRRRLYFPGKTSGFVDGATLDRPPPSWSLNLEISFQGNVVAINFKGTDFGRFPLFTDQLLEVLSNWASKNPLEIASSSSGLSDRDRKECMNFLNAAVRDCGNQIQNHLLHVLKGTENRKFDIYCRPSGDLFAEEKKLPVSGLSSVVGIDIVANDLTDRFRVPKCSQVQIKLRSRSKSKAGPRGSFQFQDAALVEEMKNLIDTKKADNVLQAAEKVLKKAPRRGKSTDESVRRRLQKEFSRRYPNDSNRRGARAFPAR